MRAGPTKSPSRVRHHPAHAAASFAKHREEMGRLAPAARVITALSMEGKTWTKGDTVPLSFDEAIAKIDEACARRAAKRAEQVAA